MALRPPARTALLRCSGAILHTKIRGWVTVARAVEMATELFTAVEIPTMELALYLAKASVSTVKKMKIAESRISITAKRILERLHHRLSKFDRSVFLILKSISYFWVFMFFYLETIGVH